MEREQSAEADSHEFNQDVPPLYVHIREVLQEYPDGQIFKVRLAYLVRATCMYP